MTDRPAGRHRRRARSAPEEFQTACKKIVISHAINELYGSRVFDEPAIALARTPYEKWLVCRVAMEEYGHHWRFFELGRELGIPEEKMLPENTAKKPLNIFALPLRSLGAVLRDQGDRRSRRDPAGGRPHPLQLPSAAQPRAHDDARGALPLRVRRRDVRGHVKSKEGRAAVQKASISSSRRWRRSSAAPAPRTTPSTGNGASRSAPTRRCATITSAARGSGRGQARPQPACRRLTGFTTKGPRHQADGTTLSLPVLLVPWCFGGEPFPMRGDAMTLRAERLNKGVAEEQAMDHAPARNPEREQFYQRIDKDNLTPLWEVLAGLVTKEPVSPCKPHIWRYDEVRPFVHGGGRAHHRQGGRAPRADAREPRPARRSRASRSSLYAGLQLIMPGEIAPAHRHTAVGAALHHRGQGRLHRGRRREDDDAAGRLRHHAVLDLARPRQRERRADGLAGRARHAASSTLLDASFREDLSRTTRSRVTRPEGDCAGRATAASCCRSATRARRQ